MSFEPGGRADKYGNRYENGYLAKLLLRLAKEEIASVIVEPLGVNKDYVEFIAEQKDGVKKYYQCKGSNTTNSSWSISNLRKYKVFERAKKIITDDVKSLYYFISPLQYGELSELCKRTRTNSSVDDFIQYQLNNNVIKSTFFNCVKEFGFEQNNPSDVAKTVSLLSRCYFEQYITGSEAEHDFEEYVGAIFTGKSSVVRNLLEHFADDSGCYGKKITTKDVIDYLKKSDIHLRDYKKSETVLGRINDLNSVCWGSYSKIYENLIHRTSTDNVIQSIKVGHSVILHGKAGNGKSGCLEEIILYLKRTGILYLSIKLDKYLPHKSADVYGQDLGLPQSPVFCLASLASTKPCVLILDQLDSLRWSSKHSGEALDVCKELIHQAEAINKHSGGKLSIVFASRTFDLDNDSGIKELFDSSDLIWDKVNIGGFTKGEVINVIGDVYNHFSDRLKKLLLTPSSLYVWSKLENSAQYNSVSSVLELMNAWWNQIQMKCVQFGLQSEIIISCKDDITKFMENRSVFSIPQIILEDRTVEINFLVSMGLLNRNFETKSISFSHQSFLDYFITADILKKIYLGSDLIDLIGNRNNQTPFIRYRVLTVLQNLLDNDSVLFAKQSVKLLEASYVRFYFKCTVFDIIGQCETPTNEICRIIDTYMQKSEWLDYIRKVVLYGHPAFIMRFPIPSNGTFLTEKYLSLLKSIGSKEPDFVTSTLRPFAFVNSDQDYKILLTLCHDASNDSNDMFEFRLQLLRNNPEFFENYWIVHNLVQRLSARAIDLFKIILESWPIKKKLKLYIGDSDNISHYVKQYAWLIVTRLFPKICEVTNNYLLHWPDNKWNYEYEDWEAKSNGKGKSAVREIVEITKEAFTECAQSEPEKLINLIEEVKYPFSAVGHECLMHAILSLPTSYSDWVVKWILEDIDQKIFVFTSNNDNYLYYFSQLVEKFSSVCRIELFQQLERYICNWKESTERMVKIYKERFEIRSAYNEPVYYAYWGHFQKILLPCMDDSRLSPYSKHLLNVINRNSWINLPYFFCGFSIGSAKTVVSPVDNCAGCLSDKTWLEIISTPKNKMKGKCRDVDLYYIEANHQSFASTLREQAKIEPIRFAKLALLFPQDCYEGYILNVLYALSDNNSREDFDVEIASHVIRRYGNSEKANISIAVSNLIKNHAEEDWPNDIVDIVEKIALEQFYPNKDEYTNVNDLDLEYKSKFLLLENSINSVRGCAVRAIAALLRNHHDLGDRLKNTVISISKDINLAVSFAVIECVSSYYGIDNKFSVETFISLLDNNIFVIYANDFWWILSQEYENCTDYYREKLMSACLSDIDDLAEHASGLLCAIGIFYNDEKALNFIMSHQFKEKQQQKICSQAVSSFNLDIYHENSEKVLIYLIDHSSNDLRGLNSLFFDRHIKIVRDEKFLIYLMKSQQGFHLFHSVLDYLCENSDEICNFARVVEVIGNKLFRVPSEISGDLIADKLVRCVVNLFDKGKDDPFICELCLDIWDKLFMSNLHVIKPLSDMIDFDN